MILLFRIRISLACIIGHKNSKIWFLEVSSICKRPFKFNLACRWFEFDSCGQVSKRTPRSWTVKKFIIPLPPGRAPGIILFLHSKSLAPNCRLMLGLRWRVSFAFNLKLTHFELGYKRSSDVLFFRPDSKSNFSFDVRTDLPFQFSFVR